MSQIHSSNAIVQFLYARTSFSLLHDVASTGEFEFESMMTTCFQANVKAIKLSPFRWDFIFQLGRYYKQLLKENKKALKCFQKAFELCQNLQLCGLELVDCLLKEKEDDAAAVLLKRAIDEIENCKWASLRLGIIHLKSGNSNEAIRLFHNVIRNDPEDA